MSAMGRWVAGGLLLALAAMAVPGAAAAQDEGIAVGEKAPAVVVNDLDGKPVDLAQYLGKKPVLLEFWATWCEVCEALMPAVRKAHATYGDRVEFFGVNVAVNQTPARVRRYVEQHTPPFRTLYDERAASTKAYQASTTSYIVIVDRTGKVAYTGSGATQDLEGALRRVVEP